MDKNSILDRHYFRIGPKRFIELQEQIQSLYDGPWVQMGAYPEDGTNIPVPADQEKARRMWRNTYRILKPYEQQIRIDYEDMQRDYYGAFFDQERQAIWAMFRLIESYHNIVELYDIVQLPEAQALAQFEETCKTIEAQDAEEEEEEDSDDVEGNDEDEDVTTPQENNECLGEENDISKEAHKLLFLDKSVRNNNEALSQLRNLLQTKIEPLIKNEYSWGHVREAFQKLGFITELSDYNFGRFICELSDKKEQEQNSIKSACYRYGTKAKETIDENKVLFIIKTLSPVTALITTQP